MMMAQSKADILQMITAALAAVDPYTCTQGRLHWSGQRLVVGERSFDLVSGRLFVVAIGKAAVAMGQAAADRLGDRLTAGIAVTKTGQTKMVDHPAFRTLFAAHPVPDSRSVAAADAVTQLLEQTAAGDLVLFLISGGASALCTQPLLKMADWQALSRALLASGCPIQAFNTVRQQLDRVKGGGLGRLAAPADTLTLVLSDVIGNRIDMIGSGPTVPCEHTPADALAILQKYGVRSDAAVAQLKRLPAVVSRFDAPFVFVGDVSLACRAAADKGTALGYRMKLLTTTLEGEASEVGRWAADLTRRLEPRDCLLAGGETTVTVRGSGIGGRNQELALSAAVELAGAADDLLVATCATDGEDGPTAAAGACVTGRTVALAQRLGLDAAKFLADNDSHTFFDRLGDHLIVTGPTGTNVNDLLFVVRAFHPHR